VTEKEIANPPTVGNPNRKKTLRTRNPSKKKSAQSSELAQIWYKSKTNPMKKSPWSAGMTFSLSFVSEI